MRMPKTVILLDDDPDEEYILLDGFAAAGFTVSLKQCCTLKSLLHSLDQTPDLPDFLFLDINLPGETGLQALSQMRSVEKLTQLPVIMYSNAADPYTIDNSFEVGAFAFVQKTTTIRRLAEKLEALLGLDMG